MTEPSSSDDEALLPPSLTAVENGPPGRHCTKQMPPIVTIVRQ